MFQCLLLLIGNSEFVLVFFCRLKSSTDSPPKAIDSDSGSSSSSGSVGSGSSSEQSAIASTSWMADMATATGGSSTRSRDLCWWMLLSFFIVYRLVAN